MGMGACLFVDGFFDRAVPGLVRITRTRRRLLAAVLWGAGILSAFVTNDAVCVLAAPPAAVLIERCKLPRLPFLLALASGANTGSVATLVGNPQNMLCAGLGQLHFAGFMLHMVPVALVGLLANHGVLLWLYRTDLEGPLPIEGDDVKVFTVPTLVSLGRLSYPGAVTAFMVGSNLVTNVPFILIVRHEMDRMPDPLLAWELLAMASTSAGNLTLLGSVANVIVSEKSKRVGGLGFFEHLRAGVPIAIITTMLGTAWLVGVRMFS
jgi:Na+/H+ antiporter NhaD/arsenite permease-like protein